MQAADEMNLRAPDMVRVLTGIGGYRHVFEGGFSGATNHAESDPEAIATFERTVVSGISPFDAWIAGNEWALSHVEKRGFELLWQGPLRALPRGMEFHRRRVPRHRAARRRYREGTAVPEDPGHAARLQDAKPAGVRLRGPYMHDGSLGTLEAVVAHYNRGGAGRPGQYRTCCPAWFIAGRDGRPCCVPRDADQRSQTADRSSLPR